MESTCPAAYSVTWLDMDPQPELLGVNTDHTTEHLGVSLVGETNKIESVHSNVGDDTGTYPLQEHIGKYITKVGDVWTHTKTDVDAQLAKLGGASDVSVAIRLRSTPSATAENYVVRPGNPLLSSATNSQCWGRQFWGNDDTVTLSVDASTLDAAVQQGELNEDGTVYVVSNSATGDLETHRNKRVYSINIGGTVTIITSSTVSVIDSSWAAGSSIIFQTVSSDATALIQCCSDNYLQPPAPPTYIINLIF